VNDKLEKLSVADGLRAVRFAEVVVVLLDVNIPFEQQDLRIADFAETEGRAVVVAANKWDLEEDKPEKLKELREAFERLLPQLRGAPLVTVSAKTGKGLDRLHNAILKAHEIWNRRISTAKLNNWLIAMTEAHPPPAPGGRRIKLRYITQAKTRPPAFVIKATHTDKIPESYGRYLVNGLRDDFDMPGTPIRIYFRDQGKANPYKDRKKSIPSRLKKHVDAKKQAAHKAAAAVKRAAKKQDD
jgi:GTP-binding protein